MTRSWSFPYPTPNPSLQNQGGDSPPELVPSHPLGFLLPRAPYPSLQNQGGDSPPELVPSHPLGFLLPRVPNPSSQNQGGDSPPEPVPSHPLGFLLPQAPNPNTAPPVLCSFFPLYPNDMDPTTPTSPIPDTTNPTASCTPTFTPSQSVNPRSSQLFLQSQEASPASQPANSSPGLRRQCITTDSEIKRQGLEALARLIEESKRAEAARISHPGLQIRNPPAQVTKQTSKSGARNITKSAPSTVSKATSSKTTPSDLFSVAKALGGDPLLDIICAAYAYYVLKDETEGSGEPSNPSVVDQN